MRYLHTKFNASSILFEGGEVHLPTLWEVEKAWY